MTERFVLKEEAREVKCVLAKRRTTQPLKGKKLWLFLRAACQMKLAIHKKENPVDRSYLVTVPRAVN